MPAMTSKVSLERLMEDIRRVSTLDLLTKPHEQQAHIKSDHSPVTLADLTVQALMCHLLSLHCPEVPIVAEEDSCSAELLEIVSRNCNAHLSLDKPKSYWSQFFKKRPATTSGSFFTFDPIDGTKGFIRRPHGQFCICLSYLEDFTVKMALIAAPVLGFPHVDSERKGTLIYATLGGGSYQVPLFGESQLPLKLAMRTDAKETIFTQGVEYSHSNLEQNEKIRNLISPDAPPQVRGFDSMVKYCLLARGEADVYLKLPLPAKHIYIEKIWDHAPGQLVVTEAGGIVFDIEGVPLDFSSGSLLSNNTGLVACHPRSQVLILNAVTEVLNQ